MHTCVLGELKTTTTNHNHYNHFFSIDNHKGFTQPSSFMFPLFLKGSYVCPYILSCFDTFDQSPKKVMAGREDEGLELNSRERRLIQRRIQQQQLLSTLAETMMQGQSSSSSTGEGGLEAVGQLLTCSMEGNPTSTSTSSNGSSSSSSLRQ